VTLRREWPAAGTDPDVDHWLHDARDDLVREAPGPEPGTFVQAEGPFVDYRRTVTRGPAGTTETVWYRLVVPWFGWLFRWATRRELRNRRPDWNPAGRQPWWAPPDRLDAHQVTVLGMLAAASMSSAFVNTLFTQTVAYSADDFGVGDWGRGVGGTIVRLGVVLSIPVAMLADRIGRRKVIVATAWAAPLIAGLGAVAPNFPLLVATQAVGRPTGLALNLLIAVAATEEMPRNSRAYAVSVLAMASGLGAGVAVVALPVAGISDGSWRGVYVLALVWLPVAVSLGRRLPETRRFKREAARREAAEATTPTTKVRSGRLVLQSAVAFCANILAAPASFFLGTYLKDERGFGAGQVALFTLLTGTPAGLGLIAGGRLADRHGRRLIASICVPAGAVLIVLSFAVAGPVMWIAALGGGLVTAMAYPAMQVYTTEMFATGRRGLANGIITASALIGGSVGLLAAGAFLNNDRASSGVVMAGLLVGPVAVAALIFTSYPETAHRELEELNPEDAGPVQPSPDRLESS
jgi:MFS family permease